MRPGMMPVHLQRRAPERIDLPAELGQKGLARFAVHIHGSKGEQVGNPPELGIATRMCSSIEAGSGWTCTTVM